MSLRMLISIARIIFPRGLMDPGEKLQQAIDLLSSISHSAPLESGRSRVVSGDIEEPGPSCSSRNGGMQNTS